MNSNKILNGRVSGNGPRVASRNQLARHRKGPVWRKLDGAYLVLPNSQASQTGLRLRSWLRTLVDLASPSPVEAAAAEQQNHKDDDDESFCRHIPNLTHLEAEHTSGRRR